MERILVSEEELIEILNKELRKREDSEGYSFSPGVMRLRDKDKDGCNWSTSVKFRGSGVPVIAMADVAKWIVAEARKKYNLK